MNDIEECSQLVHLVQLASQRLSFGFLGLHDQAREVAQRFFRLGLRPVVVEFVGFGRKVVEAVRSLNRAPEREVGLDAPL